MTKVNDRFRAVDGLRGIAALLVVFLHVEWPSHIASTTFIRNGYLAVDLFFILSGLVITANYGTRIVSVSDARRFMTLRFFRLYPLHFAMLAAFLVLESLKYFGHHRFGLTAGQEPFTGGNTYETLIANLFLVHGLGLVDRPNWNGPSWSISCEFFVYIAFALVAMTGLIRSRIFYIAGALIAALAYSAIAYKRGTLDVIFDLGIVRCAAGFFLGMLIFEFTKSPRFQRISKNDGLQISASIGVILAMSLFSGPIIVLVIPLFCLMAALLQPDRGPIANILMSRPLQFLGRISYSIYMVHSFIVVCLVIVMKRLVTMSVDDGTDKLLVIINPWLGDFLALAMAATVLLTGWFTFRILEEPGRMFGRALVMLSKEPISRHEIPKPTLD